jgi:hypothetical protein
MPTGFAVKLGGALSAIGILALLLLVAGLVIIGNGGIFGGGKRRRRIGKKGSLASL